MIHCEFSEYAAEFALGSLSPDFREAMQAHLTGCDRCVLEVGDYLEALSAVALAIPEQNPPASLGSRIVQQARSELQDHRPRVIGPSIWTRIIRQWPTLGAAAIALFAVGWSFTLQTQLETQRGSLAQLSRRYDTVVGVLAATRMEMRELSATAAAPGAQGRLFLDRDNGTGMLMHHLPPLRDGECYQLWFMKNGERVDGGVLRSNPDGSGYTIISAPGAVSDYESVGITREPSGGSRWPTSDRLLGAGI